MLIVDGVDPETVRTILETDVHLTAGRHMDGYSVLETMAGFAPTMGIIGTVMGLINVLTQLSDPENLGHSNCGCIHSYFVWCGFSQPALDANRKQTQAEECGRSKGQRVNH